MATVTKLRAGKSSSRKTGGKALTLPTKVNQPPDKLEDSVILIYGRKGIGKTTMASKLRLRKKTLTAMLEKSRKNLKIYQRNPKNFQQVLEYIGLFLKSDEFDGLSIDTIDRLHEMVMDDCLRKMGCKSILTVSNDDRPSFYREVSSTFAAVLYMVQEADKGLFLTSHETVREMENRKIKGLKDLARGEANTYDEDDPDEDAEEKASSKIERIQPSCTPAAFREVEQICNFVLYYGYMDRRRSITVRDPGDFVWVSAGSSDNFLDPDGEPLKSFYVANDPDQAYKDLCRAFNNELRDVNYKAPRKSKPTRSKAGR